MQSEKYPLEGDPRFPFLGGVPLLREVPLMMSGFPVLNHYQQKTERKLIKQFNVGVAVGKQKPWRLGVGGTSTTTTTRSTSILQLFQE